MRSSNIAGNVAIAVAGATTGIGAAAFGYADDAPGLVLLGAVLLVATAAVGARVVQRSRRGL